METKEAWEARASKAKTRGWKLLHAALLCFELGEVADAKAAALRRVQGEQVAQGRVG